MVLGNLHLFSFESFRTNQKKTTSHEHERSLFCKEKKCTYVLYMFVFQIRGDRFMTVSMCQSLIN